MKRIIICCDGTWSRLDGRRSTNVARLAQAVAPRGADGVAQVTQHYDGVGAGDGVGPVSRLLDRTLGGVFGRGLMRTVAEAYQFLAFNYAPGDEIYLFGFSRGAFTARTLAGLIRNCAIPAGARAHEVGEALALYRKRGPEAHPDAEAACAFRAKFAPHLSVSAADASWRQGEGRAEGHALRLAYVGVWDTVGALGIPAQFALSGWANRDLRFHDTRLSRGVCAARHALAIDERRRTFRPALWENLDALNADREGPAAYEQRWFPGDHGSVGGGSAPLLAHDALLWVAEGAMAQGLALNPSAVAAWARDRDCNAPIPKLAGTISRILQLYSADRTGPRALSHVSAAAVMRWRRNTDWRPGALGGLSYQLDNLTGPTVPSEEPTGLRARPGYA